MKTKLFSRDFSLMLLGQIVSLLGNALLRFALSLYVLDLTGSAAVFGGVLAASMLPTILLSPVGGVLADRIPRQRIMYVLDFITAAAVWNFALFGRGGSTLPPALLLLALSAIQACYQPSVLSSLPLLVPQEELTRANALVTQVAALSSLLGPILGGALYGLLGLGPICLVGAGCFLCSAVMECFLRIPFTPAPLLGKVGSFVTAVATCAMPLGQGLYGLLLDRFPPFLAPALTFAACLPLTWLARRTLNRPNCNM